MAVHMDPLGLQKNKMRRLNVFLLHGLSQCKCFGDFVETPTPETLNLNPNWP